MPKTFLYKLFGVGKMPDEFKKEMEYFEEGIKATVTYRDYRAPGKFFWRKRNWFSGALGYSKKGVIGILRKSKFIDVPFNDELYKKLRITLTDSYISIASNSEDFRPNTSGEIEVRFYVENLDMYRRLVKN